jgi:SulP family sulfate permease
LSYISALVFAWKASVRTTATKTMNGKNEKIYSLFGPLFFGSIESFNELFDPKGDPERVIIDFSESRVLDHSALQAIDAIAERYSKRGKDLHLWHLSKDCRALLHKAKSMVDVAENEDPHYGVAVDYSKELEKT